MVKKKIEGWERLVQRLKEVVSFGIHGTKIENLPGILTEIGAQRGIFGHYLGASEEEKVLPAKNFYDRLYASTHLAKGYSRAYSINNSRMDVQSDLLLMLGLSEELHDSKFGNNTTNIFGETFGIAHDMGVDFSFYPIFVKKDELELIAKKSDKQKERFTRDLNRHLSFEYDVAVNINNALLKNMLRELDKISNS